MLTQYSVSPRWTFRIFGPEAERKRQHTNAEPARRQEMPELVNEDEHAQHEQESKKRSHGPEYPFS